MPGDNIMIASILAHALASRPKFDSLHAAMRVAASFLNKHANKHRRMVAVMGSLLLHVVFVLLLLIREPTNRTARGFNGAGDNDGGGKGIAVEMMSDYDLQQAIMQSKVVREEAPKDKVTPLDVPQLDPAVDALKPTPAEAFSGDMKPPPSLSASQATSGGNGNNGTDDDALWQAIAPCWSDMVDANTLPVTLEISFDDQGGIGSPPIIERDPSLPADSRSQRSEVMALQALAKCGTYAMAEGRTGVKVIFPAP